MIDRVATVTDSLLYGRSVPVVRTAPSPNHIALPLERAHCDRNGGSYVFE